MLLFMKDDDRDFEEIEKELKRKAQSERDRGKDHRRNKYISIFKMFYFLIFPPVFRLPTCSM
jgi:hypothetical protein